MLRTKCLEDLTLHIMVVALVLLSAGSASGAGTAAYVTNFAGQGPVARLAYLATDNHVHELYFVASAGKWGTADLTILAGAANAAATPVAYVTDFPSPTARLGYLDLNGHIDELFYTASVGKWGAADLTALTGATTAAAAPVAYVTNFAGQAPTARLEYVGTDAHIHELYYPGPAGKWGTADLTILAGAANAVATPVAYVTDFPSPTARLGYLDLNGHIDELFYTASVGKWGAADSRC